MRNAHDVFYFVGQQRPLKLTCAGKKNNPCNISEKMPAILKIFVLKITYQMAPFRVTIFTNYQNLRVHIQAQTPPKVRCINVD